MARSLSIVLLLALAGMAAGRAIFDESLKAWHVAACFVYAAGAAVYAGYLHSEWFVERPKS